jgi:hypothetical protein
MRGARQVYHTVTSSQIGLGSQDDSLLLQRGLHPPRQNWGPEPQKPNSEQHGAEEGHRLVELQVRPPWAVTRTAVVVRSVSVRAESIGEQNVDARSEWI